MSSIKILAIESAGTLCSVALSGGEKPVFLPSAPEEKHTEVLLGLIRKALELAGVSFGELDAIAYSAGPGAFTGLRVACGTAQGLAWALAKKLLPVNNLFALANNQAGELSEGEKILAATDARMSECYTAVYQKQGNALVQVEEDYLAKPGGISRLLDSADGNGIRFVCGNAFRTYEIALPGHVRLLSGEDCDARMLAEAALCGFREVKTVSPDHPQLYYVRNHVALTIEERKELQQRKNA
ncbi:MAG: tRNA (adenosine(37)-N6)-threonylcarbamoyltransferase complex dimerization subunit type 1 TsaB [Klebsiella quasipneumoniae]|nr:tRNA (adenosine(37)-N6)-threonylcarbamoyltransferase complex dimerization subunit type 1 TsaB [Klebsiella quasipneumoniae]